MPGYDGRLILDGTVVRVRLDRKATSISLLIVIGVRADVQKVLLAIKSMGGESVPVSQRDGVQSPLFNFQSPVEDLCSDAPSIYTRPPV
jgi:hypothetical protein